MLRSSIDLGTNTCLLLIADWPASKPEPDRVVEDLATIVRLGQGVDRAKALHPEAMERALACLRGYSRRVRDAGADPAATVCVATSQARDAANGEEFFARVERETGFRFAVISGAEEARMTFLGALLPGMDPATSCVIDIGGGSTELIAARGGGSLDVGSVRFTERYLPSDPVTDEEFWACRQAIDDALDGAIDAASAGPGAATAPSPLAGLVERGTAGSAPVVAARSLVGVAGTVTTLAAWHLELERFDARRIDGAVLTRGDVHRMVEELKWRTVSERRSLTGIEAARADVLLAGALILWRSMERLGFAECRVSTRGLRYGALRPPRRPNET